MTEAVLLTGRRGEGKGLGAAQKMSTYLRAGRTVATNMDIDVLAMAGAMSTARAYRIPDWPTADDLDMLPLGNPDPTKEDMNGLLVLDEVSTFLNARTWQKGGREALLAWLAHSRKKGWDLLIIAQHPKQVDVQLRDSICEMHAVARNLSKVEVPGISTIGKLLFNTPVRLPHLHSIVTRYGYGPSAPRSDSRIFSGKDVHSYYDTLQVIDGEKGQQGVSSYLTGWERKGRLMNPRQLYGRIGLVGAVVGLLFGVAIGAGVGWYKGAEQVQAKAAASVDGDVTVTGVVSGGGSHQLVLSSGRVVVASGFEATADGIIYAAEGKRYRGAK